MEMTPAQRDTLKAFILADGTLSGKVTGNPDYQGVADILNALASPDLLLWRTDVPVTDILDAITWVNYTPADSPEATGIFTARAMVIQTKQMNLQTMLIGRQTLDASKSNVRAGLRDAVVALPAGASGASVSAGGSSAATVLAACTRKSSVAEKIYNTVSATTGTTTANLIVWEGQITSSLIGFIFSP